MAGPKTKSAPKATKSSTKSAPKATKSPAKTTKSSAKPTTKTAKSPTKPIPKITPKAAKSSTNSAPKSTTSTKTKTKSTSAKPISPEIITLTDVSRSYGYGDAETFALQNFSLSVKRGEFIMIMGPSGCGKTTLLNIIGLLDKPTSGEYLLSQKSVHSLSAARQAHLRAHKIGFIFQNFNLISTLPVIENVALPLVYSGASKTHRLIRASDTLARFHLQEREYYMPHQLSGGQQQRVAIARSLVSKPEIILADEPTGNLDSRSSHIVMEELKVIHSEGNTIIMVTHNPALTAYATRVIHMLDGHIDTDIKTVADRDLPQPIHVRFGKPKKETNS